jgi:arsenite methyltransferase
MKEAMTMNDDDIRKNVREGYAKIAKKERSGCGCGPSSCCGSTTVAEDLSKNVGYSDEELKSVPGEANLGLGCGNPVALASLKEGEYVIDLGSGAGLDCFLAAKKVGKTGKVIGVDMTPEMVEKARKNAATTDHTNVEFRLGEIENLPAADNYVDIVISNCVINLSTDKKRVFQEAFRVLKPGGRVMISDIMILRTLPEVIRKSVEAYIGCLSGAIMKEAYIRAMEEAGLQRVEILEEVNFPIDYMTNDPTAQAIIKDAKIPMDEIQSIAESIVSVKIRAYKP